MELLEDALTFLNPTGPKIPENLGAAINQLLEVLQQSRCLLVLDNLESILQDGDRMGHYRSGYEGYDTLIRRMGESRHQSCLLMTSREKPRTIVHGGNQHPVRSFVVSGLALKAAQAILAAEGIATTESQFETLFQRYAGHPLALRFVANKIRDLFASNVEEFLAQGVTLFRDIRELLAEQFDRLSAREQEILYWLAINREPVLFQQLQGDLLSDLTWDELLDTLEALCHRSLVERIDEGFTLQNVVMEYMTERLTQEMIQDLSPQRFKTLDESAGFAKYALLKGNAKAYVRDTQKRLILEPIASKTLATPEIVHTYLADLKKNPALTTSYAPSNLLNLLTYKFSPNLNYDFSGLSLRHACLQGAQFQQGNFQGCQFGHVLLTTTYGYVLTIAFSPNGQLFAMGDTNSNIEILETQDWKHVKTLVGHKQWIRAIAINAQGTLLASAGEDKTIYLWDFQTYQPLAQLTAHEGDILALAFHPQGNRLASAGKDGLIYLWDTDTSTQLACLTGHQDYIRALAFSPNGQYLVSGGNEGQIWLWDFDRRQRITALRGHTDNIRSLVFSPDGSRLVSGGDDCTLRVWHSDWHSEQCPQIHCLQVLNPEKQKIYALAFSADGSLLVGASEDQAILIWETQSYQLIQILQGHQNRVRSVALSPDGTTLASSGDDQTVRLWDLQDYQCLRVFQGHHNRIGSLAFSADSQHLISGSEDQSLRIWDLQQYKCLEMLPHSGRTVAIQPQTHLLGSSDPHGHLQLWDLHTRETVQVLNLHQTQVRSIAFSPTSDLVAILEGKGEPQRIHLWDLQRQTCVRVLADLGLWSRSLAFSPDGKTLASGGPGATWYLWDLHTYDRLHTFEGHNQSVICLAFSADGHWVASGSEDHRVCLWDGQTHALAATLEHHSNWVNSLTFSPDAKTLVSSSKDQTLCIWDLETFQLRHCLQGHTNEIWAVTFSPDGARFASSGLDQTIRIWDGHTYECLGVLRIPRPYEGTRIAGSSGLASAQCKSLFALGAID
jgi:WD40 repeat protein